MFQTITSSHAAYTPYIMFFYFLLENQVELGLFGCNIGKLEMDRQNDY